MRAKACWSDSTSNSRKSFPDHSSHSRISLVYGQVAVPYSSRLGIYESLHRIAKSVINRRLNFLNARNVIGAHDQRKIRETSTNNFSAVIAQQRNSEHSALAGLLQRHNNISGTAARGNRHCDVIHLSVSDELSQKNQFGSHIVGDGGDICWLHRERNRGYRPVPCRWHYTIERPIVGVRCGTAVAKNDQFAPALDSLGHGDRRVTDSFCLFVCDALAQTRIIARLHLNRCGDFGHRVNGLLLVFAEEGIQKSRAAHLMTHFAMLEKDVHALPERVIQNLDHFLMYEGILFARRYRVKALRTRQGKCHCLAFLRAF